MTLATLIDAELAFGDLPLLDHAQLSVQDGERLGLIGRNGTGKSSLLSVLAQRQALDNGRLLLRDGLNVVFVEQEPLLPAADNLQDSLRNRGALEDIADERDRWRIEARLSEYLQRFDLDGGRAVDGMSGGERKRAALALAFALQPDLLLLDEPTNHLDLQAIERLEDMVLRAAAAIVITHDRRFLDRVTTRIIELDRGRLASYPGNFAAYEARKSEELAMEATAQRQFDKFWAQEEAWIRQGIEARRTRNEGRVRRLQALRRERDARRERVGKVNLTLDAGERSGKRVVELKDVSKQWGERLLVRDLSLTVQRGDRLALIGANGAGKTTLLKIIVGELAPDSGSVKLGTQLEIAYFDQLRAQLDPERTVADTIAPGSDWIEVGGTRKHVMSYLADFLFPPRRAQAPVKTLSGGERNRLLLARLFARPANLLVLDEPTNDLDIESLELLEDTLQQYRGTLLIVSHDRAFLDAVATQSLVAEGNGYWREYVGGYSDWLRQRGEQSAASNALSTPAAASSKRADVATAAIEKKKIKLSYKEQRELDTLPQEIENLETEQQQLQERMNAADYYQSTAAQMQTDSVRLGDLEHELDKKLMRWMELTEKTTS